MNVGELFVTLGVEGTEKAANAIGTVQKGMESLFTTSLETKVALVGAGYAVQQMFAASGAMGTQLVNFNSVLGVSAQTLQRYQYAARQVGASNAEVEGSFKGLQQTMTGVLTGQSMPSGFAWIARLSGGFSTGDIKRFAEHPEDFLQVLQRYAGLEKDVGLRNQNLRSFGISDNLIAALVKGKFNPSVLNGAPVISDREAESLNASRAAFSNLGQTVEVKFARFFAKHGHELTKGVTEITDSVLQLAESLETLGEHLDVFKAMSQLTTGIASSLKIIDELTRKVMGEDLHKGDLLHVEEGQELFPGLTNSPFGRFINTLQNAGSHPLDTLQGLETHPIDYIKSIIPAINPNLKERPAVEGSVVNQTNIFNDPHRDNLGAANIIKRQTQSALRLNPAGTQGG